MLETADLELKVTTTKDLRGSSGPILTICDFLSSQRETTKREDAEVKLRNAEMRVQVAEDERNDRIKSEEALLVSTIKRRLFEFFKAVERII